MKTDLPESSFESLPRRYLLLAAVWCVLIAGSLLWQLHEERQKAEEMAAVAAHANIGKDISFRQWVTSHGGVYVTPTERTPPNPYLDVPGRDVVTTTGKSLTLMNPAYVLREIQTHFRSDYGVSSRITSLKPLNPLNAPDAWEAKALKHFEQGGKSLLEVQQIDGHPYLRLMEPFIVEQACLKCHSHQGYKIGDIRGGIGTTISLEPYYASSDKSVRHFLLSIGAIWLTGLAALWFSYRRDRRLVAEQQRSRTEMQQRLDELLRFQKLTIGRELRMKELVEENAALRARMGDGDTRGARP